MKTPPLSPHTWRLKLSFHLFLQTSLHLSSIPFKGTMDLSAPAPVLTLLH
ncbi:hypothetical protein JOB18_024533 [Solea senegalensis]|uniref:Uncharacterized protein n=1 Tax=Solea senegalensis TaxID=28829 RepID=A0AAV6PH79_SOLSE|nr:hypothetical protein JOB18_024533 [Solea senegalensis]